MKTRFFTALIGALCVACSHGGGGITVEFVNLHQQDPFAGAVSIVLLVDDQVHESWDVDPSGNFALETSLAADGKIHRLSVEGRNSGGVAVGRGVSDRVCFAEDRRTDVQLVPRRIGAFSPSLDPLTNPRVDFALASLANETVLVIGGYGGGELITNTEQFSPYLTRITDGPPIPEGRRGPVALVTADDTVLLLAGERDDVAVLRPPHKEWQALTLEGLPETRNPAVAALAPNKWLLAGGMASDQATGDTWVIAWHGDELGVVPGTPLQSARKGAIALPLAEQVLIVGGGESLAEFYEGNVVDGPAVNGHSAVVNGHTVLVIDGLNQTLISISAVGVVTTVGELDLARQNATAHWLSNGHLLVIAGGQGPESQGSAEILSLVDGWWATTHRVFLTEPRNRHKTVASQIGVMALGGVDYQGQRALRGDVFTDRRLE